MTTLSTRIRSARERAKVPTWAALGKLAGVNQETVRDLEEGAKKRPTLDSIQRIANALGMTVSELIGESRPCVRALGCFEVKRANNGKRN